MDNKHKGTLALGALAVAGCVDGQMVLYENGVYHCYNAGRTADKDAMFAKYGYIPEAAYRQKLAAQKQTDAAKISQLEASILDADNMRSTAVQRAEAAKAVRRDAGLGMIGITSGLIALVGLGYAIKKWISHR